MTKDQKKAKKAELQAELDALLDRAFTDPAERGRLIEHYRVTGLYQYSLLNSILIACQGGTVCNSYKRWQEMGRQVTKGEKANIHVFRPAMARRKKADSDPEETKEKTAGVFTGKFFLAGVFDVSQTYGEPLSYDHNSGGAETVNYDRFLELAASFKLEVKEETLAGPRGYTNGQKLVVSSLSNDMDKSATLVHELAHCLLNHTKRHEELSQAEREVEAEAATLLVLSFAGIEHETGPAYLSEYNKRAGKINKRKVLKAAEKMIVALSKNDKAPSPGPGRPSQAETAGQGTGALTGAESRTGPAYPCVNCGGLYRAPPGALLGHSQH